MKFFAIFSLLLFAGFSLFAGSIRLTNDSSYKLRAVVRGADGSYLGEMIILPQANSYWSDGFQNFGAFGKDNPYRLPSRSQTPYTVIWYCMDGGDFSLCSDVSTGGTVTALSCDGQKMCKPPPKKKLSPTQPEDEELYDQNEFQKQEMQEDQGNMDSE